MWGAPRSCAMDNPDPASSGSTLRPSRDVCAAGRDSRKISSHCATSVPAPSNAGMLNSLSAIHRYLPDEILIAIFAKAQSPITLSAVCHLWREISINTSTLWTTIRYAHERNKSTSLDKLRIFVARSRNAQVSVDVSVHGDVGGLEQVAGILAPTFPRSQCLCLSFTHLKPAKCFFPLPHNMADLKSLVVTLGSSSDDLIFSRGQDELYINIFQKSFSPPRLRSFHLFAPQHVTVNFPDFLDMSGMSALSLAIRMPPAKMLGLAARAPGLRTLDLMAHQLEPTDDHLVPSSYPNLERQSIAGHGWTSLIFAPSLHTLALLDQAALCAVDRAMSVRGRRPLFPNLQTLSLMTPGPAVLDQGSEFRSLAKFIQEHNQLTDLDIMACWSPIPRILSLSLGLSDQPSTPSPCPKLRMLRLSLLYDVELTPLLAVCDSLLTERSVLKIEFRASADYSSDELNDFLSRYPQRVILLRR
ncbi:uncharacterized protein EI90DRAFT_1719579 [Cantharellus anzutake]|uniref:uncharacterized protein n=1 Tax=Cantharellus anzutake TaxID=1750568 RepID=UPI00190726E8|nr:uncharacterized protein EI90DRAFT_1719579 [Cantharellus anzutake]KAF8341311.1 hypothetical protein EI90DRAFT_1719579 [Cantharellus anzutake]